MSTEKDPLKIDLDEVMISLSDETKAEMAMKIGDHKLLVKLLDAHTLVNSDMLAQKLETFANTSWDELKDFIFNQYQGFSQQLEIQTNLSREIIGKLHDVTRDIGILKCEISKINTRLQDGDKRLAEHDLKLEDHEKRISNLEREVKAIKTKIKT
jgi:predicted  nucleic acid-binding Zn-ribbon protein